ncbi:AAA family ATPase [Thermaerobacter litoralis]
MQRVQEVAGRVLASVERAVVGKRAEIRYLLAALLANRHVLIEDVPGVGKTTMVRALARSIDCTFRRIQFTPDLLPSDITGLSVYDPATRQFTFRPGPIHSQVVLADEINRTSPKTQSALLEAMEEGQVTVDGQTYPLPRPFFVLATQNPIEYEGTFPLPESQLDRFGLRIRLGYPRPAEERAILDLHHGGRPVDAVEPVTTAEEILELQQLVTQVHVDDSIKDYLVRIIQATRVHSAVYLGASPRASLSLYRLSQALAAIDGRTFVLPDDVKELAPLVLAHRLVLQPEARWQDTDPEAVVRDVLEHVPAPVERRAERRIGGLLGRLGPA